MEKWLNVRLQIVCALNFLAASFFASIFLHWFWALCILVLKQKRNCICALFASEHEIKLKMTHQKKKRNECTIYIMRKHIGLLKAYCSYRLFILDAHIFYSNIKRSSKLCLSAKKAKEKCNILPDDDDSTHWLTASATLNILRDILEHMISIFVLILDIFKVIGCQSESMFYID